jgi:hypothetical protein
MILKSIPEFDSRPFSAHSEPGLVTLVAEASDIGFHRMGQIYDDACDEGVAIRSHNSGRLVRFYHSGTDMNGDDIAGWRFKPIPEDARVCSVPVEVLIIND